MRFTIANILRETIEDTIDPSFSIVTSFPGTKLYQYCKENNLLRTENWEEYNYIHHVADGELMSLYQKARIEFYYRNIGKVWLAMGSCRTTSPINSSSVTMSWRKTHPY